MDDITSFRGRYKFLSNFSYSPFDVVPYGTDIHPEITIWFPTVEHYFQASKAITRTAAERIAQARNPRNAKHLGKRITLREDWDDIKLDVMLTGLRHKFANTEMAAKLIGTGDALLIEGNTWNDRYWGAIPLNGAEGIRWVGENHLGVLLMQVRKELQEK